MTGHTLSVRMSTSQVELSAVCHEPLGADCRMTCPEGCEDWDPSDHEHELEPMPPGECNAVDFLDNVDMEECYQGSTVVISSGDPIKVWWDGDGYVWSMA